MNRRGVSIVVFVCACLALGPGAVSAAAAGWVEPEDVFGVSQSITDTPQVAIDAAGNAVAVALRDDESANAVLLEAIERPAGGEWSDPTLISAPGETEPAGARVAVDAAGNAVATWSAWLEGDYVIRTATRSAGGEWSEPETLSDLAFITARPQLAMNAAGDAVAIWTDFEAGPTEVAAVAMRPAGGEWSEPEKISADAETARFPQVGIDAAGNATAVWQLEGPGANVVRVATLAAGDEWSEPENLSADGDDARWPRVAVDAGGTAVAVWTVLDGPDGSVKAKTRAVGGEWSEQADVSAPDEETGEAEVAIDGAGAVATWTATLGDGDGILRAAVLPNGAAEWSQPDNVSTPVDEFRSVDLETNGAAGAIAIWTRFDAEVGNSVQASVRPPGGTWTDPEILSAKDEEAGLADLAFEPAGNAIALWGTKVEEGYVVQASGYDFVAPRLAGLRIPTSGRVGEPVDFAVSPVDFFALGATSWSFGDGDGADGNAVSHTYRRPGSYPVEVSVVDAGGNTSTETTAIAITGPPSPPPPQRRLTSLSLRIGKKSLKGLRRSGALTVTAAVDGAASATLGGKVRLRTAGKRRVRLVPIFVPKTVRFDDAGERAVQLTLSKRGRKALRPLTKARIRVEGEASGLAGGAAADGAARTLRD